MKTLTAFVFLMSFVEAQLYAQENKRIEPYFNFTVAADYQFDLNDNGMIAVSSYAKPLGFLGNFDFGIELNRTTFFASVFLKSHPANSLDQYQAESDYSTIINEFSAGNFQSSGFLFGAMYQLNPPERPIPVFGLYAQIGISRTVLPDMLIDLTQEFILDNSTYRYTYYRTAGTGAIFNFGLNCKIFKTSTLAGNLKTGLLHEQTSFPITFLFEDDQHAEFHSDNFKWQSFSGYAGFSLSF